MIPQRNCNFLLLQKTTIMKALKIYSLISTIVIIILLVCLYDSNNEYKNFKKKYVETEDVLKQCSERYYKAISK